MKYQAINFIPHARNLIMRLTAYGVVMLIAISMLAQPIGAASNKATSRTRRTKQQPQQPPPGQQQQPQPTQPPTQQQQQQQQQQQPAQPGQPGAQPVPAAPGQRVGDAGVATPPQLPAPPPPVAPDYRAPARPLPPADRVGVDVTNQLLLSLNEAIALALQNSNDINASRIDVEMADFDVKAARGVYDPVLSSESYYERRTTPVASLIGGGVNGKTTTTDLTGNGRVTGFSPFLGGNYQVDFTSSRDTTDNQFAALNPQFPSALTFSYTQPLLRGLRFDDRRRRIEVAKKNLSLTDAQFRQRVIETITRVQQAYWDLTFALRNLQVQIEAVEQARLQVESNRRLVEQGVLAPIDVVAADTQVTTFEQNVYSAQEAVTRAENTLKTLMLSNRTAPEWSRALLPITPVTLDPPRITLTEAVSNALATRPEVEQLKATSDINRVNTRFFNDQTKPQIDLVGTYSLVGLAGTPVPRTSNPFTSGNAALTDRVNELSELAGLDLLPPVVVTSGVPDFLVGGYNQSLRNLLGQNFPTARIGIRFSLPVGNRTAEANLGRSLAEGRRIDTQRHQLEQNIESEIRNALQTIHSSEARLSAAASSRVSAELQYASEQRRFQSGLSTVFLVLQRQTELTAARGRELQAQTDLNKAIADFYRAAGSTLTVNNITVRAGTPGRQLEQHAQPAQR